MKSLRMYFAVLIVLSLLASCAPVVTQPDITPQNTNTGIPTMTVGPTGTPTLTVTPIPPPTRRATVALSPTLTPATTIPPLASFTPAPTATRSGTPTITPTGTLFSVRLPVGGGITWTPESSYLTSYQCGVQTVYPPSGNITVKPRTDVIVQWKVFNSGPNFWRVGDVIYGYASGEKMQNPDRGYTTISFTVYKGDKINIQVHLKSPKEPGVYTMTWGMRKSNKKDPFCLFDVTVVVVKK